MLIKKINPIYNNIISRNTKQYTYPEIAPETVKEILKVV